MVARVLPVEDDKIYALVPRIIVGITSSPSTQNMNSFENRVLRHYG